MASFFFSYVGIFSTKKIYFQSLNKLFKNLNFERLEKYSIRNKLCRRTYQQTKPLTPQFYYNSNHYDNDFHQIERIFFSGQKNVIYTNIKK